MPFLKKSAFGRGSSIYIFLEHSFVNHISGLQRIEIAMLRYKHKGNLDNNLPRLWFRLLEKAISLTGHLQGTAKKIEKHKVKEAIQKEIT